MPLAAAALAACGGGGSGGSDAAVQPQAADARRTAQAVTWTRIAGEWGNFTISGTQTVRYGADTRWVQKTVSGFGYCTSTWFGSDPAYGTVKSCEVATETADTSSGWTTIATEWQNFTTSGTQTVRYGADTRWIEKTVSGSGTCSNTWFGADPAYGTVKSCQVQAAAATAAPASDPGWTRIATEWQNFTTSGTQVVRYGADTRWIQKTVSGAGTCSNTWFGGDPAYGVVKSCEAQAATTAPSQGSLVPLVTPGAWAVIGSSTAQGVGATAGHAWVDLMRNDNAWRGVTVANFGVGGTVTYNGISVSAAVAGKPAPDPAHNVDAANALPAKLVILNYPSNDWANGYTADETVNNHLSMRNSASQRGAVTIALSSQPQRWIPTGTIATTIADTDQRLAAAFGPCFVAVRSALALADNSLNPAYDSGDGQHLNDAGHAVVYNLVKQTLASGQCVRL